MVITRKLDWLTYSHHNITGWERYIPLCKHLDEIGEEIRPLARYDKAYKLIPAGRVDISKDDHQGVVVNLTGGDLTDWNANGVSFQQIVYQAVQFGKVTRLDFATDIRQDNDLGKPIWEQVRDSVTDKTYVSRLSPRAKIEDQTAGGYTQYFGSHKSDRFIRVYDKATESGLLKLAMQMNGLIPVWSRIEIVNKRDFAHNIASDMAYNGWQQAGTALLRKLIDFPKMEGWAAIVDGLSVELTEVGRKPDRWRKWMDTSVLQSILKHAENESDREFILQWLQVVVGKVWDAGT